MKNCSIALNRKDFMVGFSGTFHYKWGGFGFERGTPAQAPWGGGF